MNDMNDKSHPFLPPQTIGILGGGQLGRMMALEARNIGYRIVTLDPTPDSPCAQVADEQVVAGFDSEQGAVQLAKKSDVLTYEFENISSSVAEKLEQYSFLPQGYKLLHTTQNRWREKKAVAEAGARVTPYNAVYTPADVQQAIDKLGLPAVLKTAEGGYDGKGQIVIRSKEDIQEAARFVETHVQKQRQEQADLHPEKHRTAVNGGAAVAVAGVQADLNTAEKVPFVLESWVPFTQEVSCLVSRNLRGEVRTFPVAENIHRDNILHVSIAPARIPDNIRRQAEDTAIRLAESFGLVGLLAIEMFVLENGTLYVNELAPRPHNSGHYTQQACATSQFEQHIRAICNLPLADTDIVHPTVMVNVLGEHLPAVVRRLPDLDPSRAKLHVYGKKEAKPKRKMGHLNVIADDVHTALQYVRELDIWNMEGLA